MLKLHKSNQAETLNMALEHGSSSKTTNDKSSSTKRQKSFDAYPKQQKKLDEADVLMDESMDEDDVDRPKRPRNVCEKLMWLAFEWSYDADLVSDQKMHLD